MLHHDIMKNVIFESLCANIITIITETLLKRQKAHCHHTQTKNNQAVANDTKIIAQETQTISNKIVSDTNSKNF